MKETIPQRPTFVANNWDRLGGRVLDVLNGYVLSQKLDCNFVFYWPQDERFPEMDKKINFFSDDFITRYQSLDPIDNERIKHPEFNKMSFNEAQLLVSKYDNLEYLKKPEFFTLPKFTDEKEESASQIYSQIALSVISDECKQLFRKFTSEYADHNAVHGRYGDLIDGNFRNYVDTGKYVDTISLKYFLERLYIQERNLIFLTDTPEISFGLKRCLGDKFQNYQDLGILEGSVQDIDYQELMILASSKKIFAPSASAFSILASRLGNTPVTIIRKEFSAIPVIDFVMSKRRRFYNLFPKRIRKQVESRDLISILQFNWQKMNFSTVLRLAHMSYRADPDYAYAVCVQAIIEELNGNISSLNELIREAETISRSFLSTHDDPLVVTLLVKYCTLPRESDFERSIVLNELKTLNPYQFSKEKAIDFISQWEKSDIKQKFTFIEGFFLFFSVNSVNRGKKYEELWERIVDADETDFLYALLLLTRKH